MGYTKHNNIASILTGTVEWNALYNDFVSKYETGRTLYLRAGENLAVRDCFYIYSDGKAYKANLNTPCHGVWQSTSTSSGAYGFGQVSGTMRYASWTWTPGVDLYVNDSGALTTTVGCYLIGYATCATEICVTPQGYIGGIKRLTAENTASITASETVTITLSIPSGARLEGVALNVDSALAELWDAAFSTGATYVICSSQATAANTKYTGFVNGIRITNNTTDIAITKNGGGTFTAQGSIRAKVYYSLLQTLRNV